MRSKRRTLLFIQKDMEVGGIENYILRTVRQMKKRGNRVIWLFPKGGYIDESYKPDLLDGSVEVVRVEFDRADWIRNLDIAFGENEEVLALAFNLFNFSFLEMLKREYDRSRIDSFYWVPHFKERAVFIEELSPKIIRPIARKIVGRIVRRMERNANIIYVSESHLNAFVENYKYTVQHGHEKLLVGYSREIAPFDHDLAISRSRSRRDEFNIVTITRFVFPHKGYLIGLIKSFAKLKAKYGRLTLTIIGYGKDEDRVIAEIEKLSPETKSDVKLVGKVPYDNLKEFFDKAHLNIGVAGTIADGGSTGLISIPCRHYCEECEGYGYLPESRKFTASSHPGTPIEYFIEEVINMGDDEYLRLSRAAYDTYASSEQGSSLDSLLSKKNKDAYKTLPKRDLTLIRLAYRLAKTVRRLKNVKITKRNS